MPALATGGFVTRAIAALYVQKNGAYFDDPTIDPWDEARDARKYDGPYPVVAHPPCQRWCQLAPVNQARYGTPIGEDGGTFESALASVRLHGGVLEHPAYSLAWPAYQLPRPSTKGGWSEPDVWGGRSCHVEQRNYGHRARKATWLYAVLSDVPELVWGRGPAPEAWIGGEGTAKLSGELRRMSKREASATPPAFKAVLVAMARSVVARQEVA